MKQLIFDDKFTSIIDEKLPYWKNEQEIPEDIKKSIVSFSNDLVILDDKTHKYYCSKCLVELENGICPKCLKSFQLIQNSRYMIQADIKKIRTVKHFITYYVFDVIGDNVILYEIETKITYDHPLSSLPCRYHNFYIMQTYEVLKDGLLDLDTHEFLSYSKFNETLDNTEDDWDKYFDLFDTFYTGHSYLYPNNLEQLKGSPLYKYSQLWTMKDYLKTEEVSLAGITFMPVYCKQFEYLVKMKLYNLAFWNANIPFKNNFRDTFGVEKKYLPFMQKINISLGQLSVLKLYPTMDIELLDFMAQNMYITEEIIKFVKPDKLKRYIEDQELDYHSVYEYYDYLRNCNRLGLDLKDKSILFPDDFMNAHDRIAMEVLITKDSKMNEKILNLSKTLEFNVYEDDKFIIFPASSIESLIDESSQMHNCVRTYCERVSANECQIYFMRYKDSKNKSLVTIEVYEGKVVQARTKYNQQPTKEMQDVIDKWEKQGMIIVYE